SKASAVPQTLIRTALSLPENSAPIQDGRCSRFPRSNMATSRSPSVSLGRARHPPSGCSPSLSSNNVHDSGQLIGQQMLEAELSVMSVCVWGLNRYTEYSK